MKHPERIEDYLEHIALAAERAIHYVEQLNGVEALQENQQAQDAVIRNIEIIGEAPAASKRKNRNLSPPTPNCPGSRCAACATR